MQVFASYIGLALHHAKLYDKIKKNEQKYKVVQEVVNYQSAAPQHEVQEVEAFYSSLSSTSLLPYEIRDTLPLRRLWMRGW